MVMRFLYWFYFRTTYFGDLPELDRLPHEERMRVVIAAKLATNWNANKGRPSHFWTFVILPLALVTFVYFLISDQRGLAAFVFMATIVALFVGFKGPIGERALEPHIRRILDEKAKVKAKTSS